MMEVEEQEARRLLNPLAGEPGEPARISVTKAMADGHRRRQVRWLATGSAVVALTAASVTGGALTFASADRPAPVPRPTPDVTTVPDVTATPTGCTVTRLPVLEWNTGAKITAVDPSGQFVVGLLRTPAADQVVLWRDGAIAGRIAVPGDDAVLVDVNRSGEAVGYSTGQTGVAELPYAYTAEGVVTMSGGVGRAVALNDDGVIVGRIGERAVRWPTALEGPAELPVPVGTSSSTAVDIDGDGSVLGTVLVEGRASESAYLWHADGTGDFLPLPSLGAERARFFEPVAMAGDWITGRGGVVPGDDDTYANFRYHVPTGRYERLPDDGGQPVAVAANGWTLGAGSGERGLSAAISATGRVFPMPVLDRELPVMATALSDDGLVAGGNTWPTSREKADDQALLWRCRATTG